MRYTPLKFFEERDENQSFPVVAPVPPAVTIVNLFTFRVPSHAKLVLTHFGNYLDVVGAWGVVTWRILKNGIGVPNYDAILDPLGTSMEPRKIRRIAFRGGDELTINVESTHVANINAGVAIKYEFGDN